MKRHLFIFLVALLTLSGSLVTAFSTLAERDFQLRGYADPSQDANLPFRVPRLGVNVELTQYQPAQLETQFGLMEQAHITWLRQAVRWDQLEPRPGEFHWQEWDTLIQQLGGHPDLRLVAVLVNTPGWARGSRVVDSPTVPPENPEAFAAFARAFASRYGDTIDYYQIWDEPNLADAWGGLEPRPAEYVALLAAAYHAVHSADQSATVISAALAPTLESGPTNISDLLYLRDMYALGAQPYMDAAAAKPYGFNISPGDRSVQPDTLNFSRIIALREEMVRHGDGKKALWASNWGWNALPENWQGNTSIWGQVSAADQITFTVDALSRAEREWPWLGGMILQHWQPDAPPEDASWGFALIDRQGSPSPLWHILTQLAPPEAAQNGLFPPGNPYARYYGVWKFGPLGADIGWVQDSQFDFDFTGKSISLLLRQDDYTAYLYPTVDGEQANTLPQDASGNAYLILTSGSLLPETNLVSVAHNLTSDKHTLHVVADRGWDRWALAGFGVSSGNLTEPYNRQINMAWFVAFVALCASAVTGWQARPTFALFLNVIKNLSFVTQWILSAAASAFLLMGMLLTWGDGIPHFFRRDPIPLILAIATAGLLKLHLGIVITLISAAVLLVIFYHRTDIGLTLTLFLSPFFLFPVELYRFAFPLAEVMILLTTAAWLMHLFIEWGLNSQSSVSQFRRLRSLKNVLYIDYAVLAWVALGFLALTWSARRAEAITELRVLIIEPALFYLIFRTSRLERQSIVRILDAVLLAGVLVAVIGLWQFFQGQSIITAEGGAQRLASVYGSPNNVGLFLGRCIPFFLAFLIVRVDLTRRIIAGVCLIPIGLAVLLSQSVGAIFVGIPAAIFVVFILVMRRRARWVLVALTVVGLAVFILALQSPRFARVLDFSSGTNFYRIRVWQSALSIIHDHPLTGLGLDQFLYAFRGHYILPDAWQEPNLSHPHNILLDFWVRLGILGVVLLLAFQIIFWTRMRHLYHLYRAHDPLSLALIVGTIGSMANLVAHGLIDNSVYVHDLAYVFVTLLALSHFAPTQPRTREPLTNLPG